MDAKAIDTLIERPVDFSIDGKRYRMWPMTLGKSLIISTLIEQLDVDREMLAHSPVVETMRLASLHPDIVARIIAIACAKGKQAVTSPDRMARYEQAFAAASVEDRASLLNVALSYDRRAELCRTFGIDRETDRMHKALRAKKDASDLTFGGCSIWGQLIDPVCERYGWTMDYVLWGIGYTNLMMLVADKIQTIYLPEQERKSVHLPARGTNVKMADNMTADELKSALGIK